MNSRLAPVIDIGEARQARNTARLKIVQAANRHRLYHGRGRLGMYTVRHIQQAVRVVRHWRLIDDTILTAAGYRPSRSPDRTPPGGDVKAAA